MQRWSNCTKHHWCWVDRVDEWWLHPKGSNHHLLRRSWRSHCIPSNQQQYHHNSMLSLDIQTLHHHPLLEHPHHRSNIAHNHNWFLDQSWQRNLKLPFQHQGRKYQGQTPYTQKYLHHYPIVHIQHHHHYQRVKGLNHFPILHMLQWQDIDHKD